MTLTERQDAEIAIIIKALKERFVVVFGDPSYDEIVKFTAIKDLYKMTSKGKSSFLGVHQILSVLPDEEYIEHMLTLIKLISLYGKDILSYPISFDLENAFIDGKMEQILYSFNRVLATEYEKYAPLFKNIAFINHIQKADSLNRGLSPNERQKRKHLKIDYAVSKYEEHYGIDMKTLIEDIIGDIDNHLELTNGRKY